MTDLFTKEHHLQIEVVEESGKVGTLIFESLSQFASRGTVNHARCCFQVLNEMFAGKSVNQISVFILIPPTLCAEKNSINNNIINIYIIL